MDDYTTDPRRIPHAPLLLGFAGALPFILSALLALSGPPAAGWAAQALASYGAVILSFLGGVHWGIAMAAGRYSMARLGTSVLPALVAWAAILAERPVSYLVLATAFALLLIYDLRLARAGETPGWYPALRWPLTAVVVACLCLAALSHAR